MRSTTRFARRLSQRERAAHGGVAAPSRRIAAFIGAWMGVALLAPISARAHEWDMRGHIGVATPLGDLSDTHDPGLGLEFGLTRWVDKWVGFHLGAAINQLGGQGLAPDLTMWHYNAGLETDLIDPETSKWRLHVNLGVGATTTSAERTDSSTDLTFNLGPNVEYKFDPHWNALAGLQAYFVMADPTQMVLPIYVGFRYAFMD